MENHSEQKIEYYYHKEGGAVIRVIDNKIQGWRSKEGFVDVDMNSWDIDVDCIPCTEDEAKKAIERWDAKVR